MPDVFVAPDEKNEKEEKSARSRKPLEHDTPPVSEEVHHQQPAQPRTTHEEKHQQTVILPQQQVPVKTEEEEKSIFDVEKRNGILPLFASFWQNPRNIYFDTQEPDEHILLFLRRHFVTNSGWIFFTLLLLLFPPFLFYILYLANYSLAFLPPGLTQIIIFLYYLFVLTNAFVNFLDWYYNITVITTKRVLDIQLKDLISKKVAATKLSLIQDIDFKQTGAIPSLFHYGDIIMQTAAKEINFIAESIPNPEYVVQIVHDMIGKKEETEEEHATS